MKKHLLIGLALSCICSSTAYGRLNHLFITGPFKSGPEVTKTCLECHQQPTKAFMKTVHWNWTKKQTLNGKTLDYGKRNPQYNFCGTVPPNWASCTSCHAGYGWVDSSFDFNNPENIDCLVCHETTGTYRKGPAGYPVTPAETKAAPAGKPVTPADTKAAPAGKPVTLVEVAKSVTLPPRSACGSCHFYGGGADGAKHGDLDSSLADPTPEMDIHMGEKGLTCISCHKGANHDVRGEAISISFSSGPRAMGCTDCHKGAIHPSAALNKHISRVACQTCHIPNFARTIPTITSWDWSTAGKDIKDSDIKKDANGRYLYDRGRGDLTWGKNLVPTYMWYNGAIDKVLMGDKIDPTKVVNLSAPKGERKDPNARIFPFKIMKGKLPYDTENNTLAFVGTSGPSVTDAAYWVKFDWNRAIDAGMKEAGLPYSGKYGWAQTSTVWALNHMVAPKQKALSCPDCHVEGGRMNWKELGYPNDPR